MNDLERVRPVSSLPTRIGMAPGLIKQRRLGGRETLSPADAHNLSWSRPSGHSHQSSSVSEAAYQRVVDHTIAELEHGNSPPSLPHQRHPSQTQSQPNLPVPLIAQAGKRPPRPSLRASLTAGSSFHIARVTSAPPILPVATQPKSQLRQVVNGNFPVVDWRKLPQSVFELVLCRLRHLHIGRGSSSCTTCLMRDLSSLERTCRTWYSAAQKHLYSKIQIVGADSPLKLKRFKAKHGPRLILLRQTLRSRPRIAALVRDLHVPDPIIPLYLPNGHPNPEYDDYLCLLASVVMTCPNLERFTGFHPFYNHTFDRLTHALSTRTKLTQHVWIIAENDEVSLRSKLQLPPGLLDAHQVYEFQTYHDQWTSLETLMLCSPASLGVLEHNVFVTILHSLPALKNLCISSFDTDDFNDFTLLALPHLRSLRLEECVGITDGGLARWAASPNSFLIEQLSLLHQGIASLVTISKVLAGLDRLQKFTILQTDVAPSLPLDMVVFQPLFASKNLRFLHWDVEDQNITDARKSRLSSLHHIFAHGGGGDDRAAEHTTPNMHLALSILHHGFPALTHLRAPRDVSPPGVIQSVCRPAMNANILLPQDRLALHSLSRTSTQERSNSLQMARLRAQKVIEEAMVARKEHTKVLVTDHSLLPSVEEMEGMLSASTSRSSNLSHVTASTDATELEVEVATEGGRFDERRYRIGEDWDKEVVVVSRPSKEEELVCRCTPTVEQMCRCNSQDYRQEIDRLKRSHATRTARNRREEKPEVPARSPLRDLGQHEPMKVQEFSLPTFIGRVSIHISSSGQTFQPPMFHLLPDIEGRESNGGLVGWGELLRVSERAKAAERRMMQRNRGLEDEEDEEEWIRDGCDGSWNRDRGRRGEVGGGKVRKESRERGERWRHTERERGRGQREGRDVGVGSFF